MRSRIERRAMPVMSPRERLFAALRGESTDHVPVWLLFPHHPTSYYADVRQLAAYRPAVEQAAVQAVTLNRRNSRVPLFPPDVVQRREERPGGVVRDILEWKDVRLYSERRPDGIRKLLDTDEDLEAWASLPFLTDPAAIAAHLDAGYPAYQRERAEFPTELGAMMLDLGEPVSVLYHQANLESYAVWSLTHDDTVRRVLDVLMKRCQTIYRWFLERQAAGVYFLVGSELAAPPLVSRATFQRWVIPYARALIAEVRAGGAFAIQHFHGQIRELLDDFRAMAPDALHTIEAPPVGNCTFAQAYEGLGAGVTLIGNIQYDDFRSLAPEAMRRAVAAVLDQCRGRRLILSPTAGPFDPDPPPRLIENYLAFMDEAWRRGEWTTGVGGSSAR